LNFHWNIFNKSPSIRKLRSVGLKLVTPSAYMEFSRIGDDVLLRLDPGEEIHQSIQRLSEHGIDCAVITSGIGRVRDIRWDI
jgi:hypothetical protein